MQKEIEFIPDEAFRKLTKREKMQLPQHCPFEGVEVNRALFINTNRKMSGYRLAAIFLQTDKGWFRGHDYDCFSFSDAPMMLRGDFEYGGIVFFLGDDKKNNYVYSYGHSLMYKGGEQYKRIQELLAVGK